MNDQVSKSPAFFRWLSNVWVDRTIAILALTPFFYVIYGMLIAGSLGIPEITVIIQFVMIIITMVAAGRR